MAIKQSEVIIANSIEKEFYTVQLRADGIVHVHFKEGTVITVEMQENLAKIYNEITKEPRPFIFTGGEFVSITKEARLNAIKMEPDTPIASNAIIVRNLAQRIIADYYYKFNKPARPYKVFKNYEEGISWIKNSSVIPEVA